MELKTYLVGEVKATISCTCSVHIQLVVNQSLPLFLLLLLLQLLLLPLLLLLLLLQIARSLAIYHVDEVVIYEDGSGKEERGNKGGGGGGGAGGPGWNPNNFFARLLQYLETPQYLRKVRA